MGKDKSSKSDKKEKKEKKSKLTEDGIKKSSSKKDKKSKLNGDNIAAAYNEVVAPETVEIKALITTKETGEVVLKPVGALVPFANPLADEKLAKKVLKSVKKAAKHKTLKRGVKEVVKSLRKSPIAGPSSSSAQAPYIVVLAADISPMDVISHIPVLCEDHGVPYLFVTSRAELGAAGNTKRPTSVVMVCERRGGKGKEGDGDGEGKEGGKEEEEEYKETYRDLVKVVEREARSVRV